MINKAFNIYRTLNVLSIDVAIGAMCSALFLGSIFQANISYTSVLVLGLTVWLIYTADHLLDVVRLIRVGLPCSTIRHQFHQSHFNLLRRLWILASILVIILLGFIPHQIVVAGAGLSIIVAMYLLVNAFISFGKEFLIAIIYVGGVLLPTELSAQQLLNSPGILLCFFISVLFNVLMFSCFDFHLDGMEKKDSFVRVIGLKRINFLFIILFAVQLLLSSVIFITTPHTAAALVLIIMTSIMTIVLYFKERMSPDLHRVIGEAVFLLPGFYWLFAN
jgi:hypothetical protein